MSNQQSRPPSQKRISIPNSQRLTTITEGPNAAESSLPHKSILRHSASTQGWRVVGTSVKSYDTSRTAPPAYDWVPEPSVDGINGNAPVEGEKLARLRRGHVGRRRERGGWGRLAIIALVVLALTGLIIGLAVGLTVGKKKSNAGAGAGASTQPAGTETPSTQVQRFPLGEYSFVTALRSQQTNCTSNAATWRCYPYSTWNPSDSSTNSSSLATFNWIITNTSTAYATNNNTASTSPAGIPANLTISSTNNPFAISFTNESLNYIAAQGNDTSARYTFSFQMSKNVIPSPAITSDGSSSECFFNTTTFSGNIYLEAPKSFPGPALADATGVASYTQWPYAVEVQQSSPGGANVPACYKTVSGVVGSRITDASTPQSEDSECICDYRNF